MSKKSKDPTNNSSDMIETLRKLWRDEFLPTIRKELQLELSKLNDAIKLLNARCQSIEDSQSLINEKFEEQKNLFHETKRQTTEIQSDVNLFHEDFARLENRTSDSEYFIDDMQQYLRRDCVEITGIPESQNENLTTITCELAASIGVTVKEEDISTINRLPDTKKVKNRIIAKFTRRSKRDEIYKSRKKLAGKTTQSIPSCKSAPTGSKIFINESLTSYRKRLYGRILQYKKTHNYKFILTQNGKIYLKYDETSPANTFTTEAAFDSFEYGTNH